MKYCTGLDRAKLTGGYDKSGWGDYCSAGTTTIELYGAALLLYWPVYIAVIQVGPFGPEVPWGWN
jgi:hypothetical protein